MDLDLSKLTDIQVDEKINSLYKILRSGNPSLYTQCTYLLTIYEEEHQKRLDKKMAELNQKYGGGEDFDDGPINIGV